MRPNEATVGQHIRDNIIPPGMSIKAAAARLGVGRPALSNLLNDKAALSPKMALRLERVFGASRAGLLQLQASHDDECHRQEENAVAVGGYVPTFLTIKAHDIVAWAERTAAREHLPVLLRKLIHATGRDLERVDFPGFDNSQRLGWDGWVEARTATPWIPEGASGWEFGTSARPRQKADDDYDKRFRLPFQERARCTFVFVTPRNWPGKTEWARQKEASGDGWRAVRAYDASDLEQWLEESVAAPIWLAGHLPMPVEGVKTLEACWTTWASAATPNLTPHIFASAVAACIKPFKRWLEASPHRPFLVAADSTGEALAFIACLFEHTDVSVRQRDLATVFTSSKTLTTLAAASSPFIPIAANAETQESLPYVFKRMHCIATCPRNAVDPAADFALPLMGRTVFAQALEAMGVGRHDAQRLISESGRSPTILRRRLSSIRAIRKPPWVSDQTLARRLVPICLVGAWHAHKSADREVLEKLTGCQHEELERKIAALQHMEEDCPVWSVGQHRGVTSKVDALFAIAPWMTEQDIGKFLEIAEDVLSEPDPALELPESDRWMAPVHGKVRDHSAALRDGICETLVLLSVHGDGLFPDFGIDVAGQVSGLVTRLLTPLDQKLQSQERDLATYAEAAPDRFLEMLEEDLRRDEPAVHQLLRPVPHGAFAHCPRTGLLGALECIAWNPDFLARVCIVLAQLSRIEIDDNWANPAESLAGILRSWKPQTAASLADRKAVLAMLAERLPPVAWRLCMDEIGPGQHSTKDNCRPRWRSDASDVGNRVTEPEWRDFARSVKGVLLSWQEHDQSTFGDLVEHMGSLTEEEQSSVWAQMEKWAGSKADDEAKAELRERIRLFASGDHASLMYEELQPDDLIVRHGWLFAGAWVRESQDAMANDDDFKAHDSRIDSLRQSAMEEVWAAHGLTGIMAMVENGCDGSTVGQYAASCATSAVDVLRACLFREVTVVQFDRFMDTFIAERADPVESELLLDVSQQLDFEQSVRLWCRAPFQDKTWRMLDRLPNEEVREEYWRTVLPSRVRRFTESECTEVVEKFLAAGRPQAAFVALARQWTKIETASLKRLLMNLVSAGSEEGASPIAPSDVSDALSVLGERSSVPSSEMARLEFAFVAVLDKHGTPNLERQIEKSPAIFVEILSYAFKRLDGGQDPKEWQIDDESRRKAQARAAHRLLQQISRIPGTEASGSINIDALLRWLTDTRRLCAKVGRADIGDLKIGELLSKAPPDDDGTWPCDAICKALDAVASSDVLDGFVIGKRNARGVFWRRGDGGDDEREIAKQYRSWAQRRRIDYPLASRAIDQIAQWYDSDAKREDAEATLAKRLNTRG